MPISAEYPYDEYNLYIVYHKKEKRNYAQLVLRSDKSIRTTISYARYLMSVKEKRILEKREHVDHINEIKTDDTIENLQILTNSENSKKYRKIKKITRTIFILECPCCLRLFKRDLSHVTAGKNNKLAFCSRKCVGIYYSRKNVNMGT
jgi:hypothetical protein